MQKAITVFAYFSSATIGAYILDWADKRIFASTIKEAERRGIIAPDASAGLQRFIEGRDGTIIFAIILIGLFCVVLGWLFMRWAAKRNWSLPVTLDKAVEFRTAMRKLGITSPEEEIAFVRRHKIPVFIALRPLAADEQEKTRAQLYAFAHHPSFSEPEIFERHIGKQTLCLDADDYERLLQEYGPKTRSAYSVRIAELEQNVADLKAVNSLQYAEIATLTEEKKKLQVDNANFQHKQQTAQAREEGCGKQGN